MILRTVYLAFMLSGGVSTAMAQSEYDGSVSTFVLDFDKRLQANCVKQPYADEPLCERTILIYDDEKLNLGVFQNTGIQIPKLVWTGVKHAGQSISPDEAISDIKAASKRRYRYLKALLSFVKPTYGLIKDMPYVGEHRCVLYKSEKFKLQTQGYRHLHSFEAVTNKIIKSWIIEPGDKCK